MTQPFTGHKKIISSLMSLQERGRLPHALLFLGPEGIGKQKVAHHLAQRLLCQNPLGPCGECRSCYLSREGKHPDLILVEPESGRIKIDMIREVKSNLVHLPLLGTSRVVLINDAHTMNIAAANALLKSLEEPPPGTYFILVTHALGWLPKTIASRCQKFRFSPLSDPEIKEILEELDQPLPEDKISWAQGSPLQALQILQAQGKVPDLSALLPNQDGLSFDEIYQWTQSMIDEDQGTLALQTLLLSVHQALLHSPAESSLNFDLLTFSDRILEIRRLLRQNINPRIHLLRLLLYFQEPKESRL